MPVTGDTLTMPDGTSFSIVESAADSGGKRIEFEISMAPGALGPPKHFHPRQEERWEALEGTISVYVKDGWRDLREGDSVTIPVGQAHTIKNRSDRTVRVRDSHSPALDFEDYIRTLHRLARAGKLSNPRRPSTLIYFALAWREQHTQTAAQLSLRVALPVLAGLGKLLRYRTTG